MRACAAYSNGNKEGWRGHGKEGKEAEETVTLFVGALGMLCIPGMG